MAPALMADHGNAEVVRQSVGFHHGPVLLDRAAVAFGVADETVLRIFVYGPRQRRARQRIGIRILIPQCPFTKIIQPFAQFAARPVNPCGQIPPKVTPGSSGLGNIGQCDFDADIEFVCLL